MEKLLELSLDLTRNALSIEFMIIVNVFLIIILQYYKHKIEKAIEVKT